MAGEIAYKLTADEANALQAVSRLSRECGLNETAIKKAVEATKELDRTQQQMGREAQRIWEQTRTPMEQQLERMLKLGELYDAGKIDAETYGRAVDQVGQKHQQAFGMEAVSALKNFASAFLPAISAADLLRQTLAEVGRLKDEAAQRDRSAEMSEGSLAEVAGGDPERFKALVAQSRGIAASAGMERNQAAALTFAAASAGALDQVGTFAQLKGQGVVSDPEALMRATQTIQTAMGAGQTGSLRDITSRLLAAGEHSPKKIAQLGPAAALAGVNAQSAGVGVNELLAAVAVESEATGDASIAGTMQKSLQKTLAALQGGKAGDVATDEEGHILDQQAQKLRADARKFLAKGGKGLMGQIHAIQSMGLDPQQLQKLFGRQEGLMAYQLLLRNEAEYQAAVGEVGAAPGRDLTGRVLGLPHADLQLEAARDVRVQEKIQEEAAGPAGTEVNLYKALLARRVTRLEREGKWFGAGLQETLGQTVRGIPGAKANILKHTAETGEGLTGSAEDLRLWQDIIRQQGGYKAVDERLSGAARQEFESKFAAAVEKFDRAAEKMTSGRPALARPDDDPGRPIAH